MTEIDPGGGRAPLSREALRTLIGHVATLRAEYGDVLANLDLVEPTGAFFPDEFALEPAAIARLLRRMMSYAPLSSELDVQIVYVEPEGEGASGGCSSGACGTGGGGGGSVALRPALETDEGYAVPVMSSDVGDPRTLTATFARSIGQLVLLEAGEEIGARDEGAAAEMTAAACGLGTLLLNGACVYKKGCGGMKRRQATVLDVETLAMATALFVRVQGAKPAAVRRHLEVTQREAFDAALAFLDGQPKLVRALTDDPASLVSGDFELEAPRGFLGRLFGRKRDDDAPTFKPVVAKKRSEEELRRLAEHRALVEEALQET